MEVGSERSRYESVGKCHPLTARLPRCNDQHGQRVESIDSMTEQSHARIPVTQQHDGMEDVSQPESACDQAGALTKLDNPQRTSQGLRTGDEARPVGEPRHVHTPHPVLTNSSAPERDAVATTHGVDAPALWRCVMAAMRQEH